MLPSIVIARGPESRGMESRGMGFRGGGVGTGRGVLAVFAVRNLAPHPLRPTLRKQGRTEAGWPCLPNAACVIPFHRSNCFIFEDKPPTIPGVEATGPGWKPLDPMAARSPRDRAGSNVESWPPNRRLPRRLRLSRAAEPSARFLTSLRCRPCLRTPVSVDDQQSVDRDDFGPGPLQRIDLLTNRSHGADTASSEKRAMNLAAGSVSPGGAAPEG